MSIQSAAADLASRVAEMARDNVVNNEELIVSILKAHLLPDPHSTECDLKLVKKQDGTLEWID